MSQVETQSPPCNTSKTRHVGSAIHHLSSNELRPKISVIIPTLNEELNLPHVLPRIPVWVEEIIIVDGHSTDNTVDVAQKLHPKVRIVMEKRRGKGSALRQGFAEATGDIIVMIDADGSTNPEELPVYIGALLAGADYVKGSRFLQGGGSADLTIFRTMGNLGFTFLARMMFGCAFSDLCYGYNAFWSHVVEQLDLDADGFEIETQINVRALRAGLKVAEVPSYEALRVHGESHLNPVRDGMRVLKTLVREFTGAPLSQAPKAVRPVLVEDFNGRVEQ